MIRPRAHAPAHLRAGFARRACAAARLFATGSLVAACHHGKAAESPSVAHSSESDAPAKEAPAIDSIRPDSVVVPRGAVVEVVIRGHGFAPSAPGALGENTIHFAGMAIPQVPANAAGTAIHFVIPDVVTSRGEAPPQPLDPGAYPLAVATSAGTSNAVILRVFR